MIAFLKHRFGSFREFFRSVLLITTVVVLGFGGWLVAKAIVADKSFKDADVFGSPLAYTEPVKAAIAIKVDSSNGLSQATLILIGVLWGLIVAKKDDKVLSLANRIELFAFVVANCLLLGSMYMHVQYSGMMAEVHTATASPIDTKNPIVIDYRIPLINDYFVLQIAFMGGGLILTAASLFCAHLLPQESSECDVSTV